jgi:hypothetical protein
MRSRRGLVALCATTLAATVLASLADAHAARRPIDVTGGEGAISQASVGARESVLVPARLSRATVTWTGGPTTASTGETLVVYVSTALPLEAGTPQTWADYFAGLLHGPELTGLTAYVATLREVQEICGGEDVLGCY